MNSPTLDDFMAWNDQLAALIDAEIPLNLGFGRGANEVTRRLERINALVARRASQGSSLAEALGADDDAFTQSYRALSLEGLQDGDLTAGLPAATQFAESALETKHALSMAFLYPLLVCCLAVLGLVGFCVLLAPRLEAAFSEFRVSPHAGLKLIESLRATMPLWAIGLPVGLLAVIAWGKLKPERARTGRRTLWPLRFPGLSRAVSEEQMARAAEVLATLLDKGTPLPDALQLVANGCGDADFQMALKSLTSAAAADRLPADGIDAGNCLPPFFCWAVLRSEGTTGRPAALRMAATIYRDAAQRRRDHLRFVAPVLVTVVLGGSVTLLYGLTLFLPIVDLLHGLAYSTP